MDEPNAPTGSSRWTQLSVRTWLLLYGITSFLLSIAVALGPLQGVVHVNDEVVYTLQSKLFAAGMRTGPAADNASMLLYPFWVTAPESYAAFPPGWPAILALGEIVGLPWIINPLLAACLPLLVYALTLEWTDSRTARIAALLVAISPAIWMLGASRMAHTSVLVALASAWLVLTRRKDAPLYWVAAGAAVAYVMLARPFDAFLIGLPLLGWGLYRARNSIQRLALALPVVVALVMIGVDNQQLTGNVFEFPIRQWADHWYDDRPNCDRLGIGEQVGCVGEPYTWSVAMERTWTRLMMLDRSLLGMPGGLILAILGLIRLRQKMALGFIAIVILGYGLYWSPGVAYGSRFFHPTMLVLPMGLAGFVIWVTDRLVTAIPSWVGEGVVATVCALGGSQFLPDLAERYWCVDGSLAQHLEAEGIENGLIYVHTAGSTTLQWSKLGMKDVGCSPVDTFGAALQLMDPTQNQGGIQPRHAPPNASDRALFLQRLHPHSKGWLYIDYLTTGERHWTPVETIEDPQAESDSTPR